MASVNVISELKEKTGNHQYSVYKLGPELKYIGSLPLSGNNNLEEQLLLSGNKIIKSWEEPSGIKVKITEFRTDSDNNNYYILEHYGYEGAQGSDAYVDEDGNLHLSQKVSSEFDYTNNGLVQNQYDAAIVYDSFTKGINFAFPIIDEEEILYYINNSNNKIKISSKNIIESVDQNNVTTRKEIITNFLS